MAAETGIGWTDATVNFISTMVDQPEYDRDAGKLLALKRLGVRWTGISIEPQLGRVDPYMPTDWIITGGESRQSVWERNDQGVVVRKPHDPRPYHASWADSLIEQCAAGGVPLFVKQMGDNAFDGTAFHYWPLNMKNSGKDPAEWPERLRVQQMPRIYDNEPARTLL